MTAHPLVSIIIPVYNGSNYLDKAIQSALSQTYPHIEIIVVNDGSCDGGKTEEIALRYGSAISYYKKENGGVASALNMALAKAKGDFISWLSHDDVYHPHKIETQINLMRQYDEKTILYSDYELIDQNDNILRAMFLDHQMLKEKPLYSILRCGINGCSLLIPKEAFLTCGNFDESLKTTQDYDLWFRMRTKYHFRHVPGILMQLRGHEEQGSIKDPNVLEEGNHLWIKFAQEVSKEEILESENSKFVFYKRLSEYLETTRFKQAAQYAKKMAEASKHEIDTQIKETLVSVIIPFQNRIQGTIEAISSVLAQSHQNFEIILINNQSTDSIEDLLQMIEQDGRIRYAECDKKGAAAARNVGLRMAKGDYIAFLNSDDLWMPEKLEKQLSYMLLTGAQMTYTGYACFSDDPKQITSRHQCDMGKIKFPDLLFSCKIASSTVMVKNRFVQFHQLEFVESLEAGEDIFFWLQVSYYTDILFLDSMYTLVRRLDTGTDNNHIKISKALFSSMNLIIDRYQWEEYQYVIPFVANSLLVRHRLENSKAPSFLFHCMRFFKSILIDNKIFRKVYLKSRFLQRLHLKLLRHFSE